jgi:DNA polymerase
VTIRLRDPWHTSGAPVGGGERDQRRAFGMLHSTLGKTALMNVGTEKSARDLLAFYKDAGVDALVQETPVDRFAGDEPARAAPARAATPRPAASPAPIPAAAQAPAVPEEAALSARELARSAKTLDELKELLRGFDGCALKQTATQLVFADGTPGARVMFVGEAPGRDEDIEGKPFVGRSGQLLDRMLAAIGHDRTNTYIANVIPWRPPGNRTPTPQETEICLPFIRRQIELADPDLLVLLGGAAVQSVLGRKEGVLKLRGRSFDYDTGRRTVKAFATLHPAYLLRSPLQKRLAWRDFRAIRRELG